MSAFRRRREQDRAARHLRQGMTLVEMVISIAVLAIGLVGTLQVVRAVGGRSADPMVRQQVAAIADSYLNEILLRDFYDPDLGAGPGPCPPPEASRTLFDNVCDYDLHVDVGARDALGNPIPDLAAYTVQVSVDDTAALGGLAGPADLLRVDVRVTFGTSVDLSVSGYRARL